MAGARCAGDARREGPPPAPWRHPASVRRPVASNRCVLCSGAKPVPVQSTVERKSKPAAGAGAPTVLVVDDEPDILTSMAAFLAVFLGWRVETADSGSKALQVLSSRAIDVVVTDYRMPGMDGLELLSRVRRKAPRVPVLVVTAYPDME